MNLPASAFYGAPVREKELQYIVDCIKHGQCCSVVGPSNTGKSYLLRSLAKEEIRQQCTLNGNKLPVMVFVDCLEAGGSELAFYELLLRRTIEELEVVGESAALVERLQKLHNEILNSTVDVAVRSIYARSVRQLGFKDDVTIVLILDEFYDVFKHLPPWPFRQLRALYDARNTNISFVTGTSHHLEQLRPGDETYEFRELFQPHTLILQPLTTDDAHRFVEYLVEKQEVALSKENISLIVKLSGGHPGILERIYFLFSEFETDLITPLQITASDLYHKRPIQKECERLWSELQSEHEALLTLVKKGGPSLTPGQREILETKGLLLTDDASTGEPVIFSSVFQLFVEDRIIETPVRTAGLRCNFESGQIWVGDQEVTLKLSEPQRKLIGFLYQNMGTICTYDEIAEGVWGVGEGVSPGAIYELVKRVRQKIEPDWKKPRFIVTVPGKGYRIQNSEE
jgi:DNA-binding winged helix-turn-helix (wHTH) protein